MGTREMCAVSHAARRVPHGGKTCRFAEKHLMTRDNFATRQNSHERKGPSTLVSLPALVTASAQAGIPLLFAKGYSVPLDAENTEAKLDPPTTAAPQTDSANKVSAPSEPNAPDETPVATSQAHLVRASYMPGQQPTPPPLPPLPQEGPSPAVLFGATAGGAAAFAIGMLIWAHHRAVNLDYVLFDSGWQFQIVLDQPLTIDASRISTLAASPAGTDSMSPAFSITA